MWPIFGHFDRVVELIDSMWALKPVKYKYISVQMFQRMRERSMGWLNNM